MTAPTNNDAAQVREALEASLHIGECAEHPDHLMDAEMKARKALPALDRLAAAAERADEAQKLLLNIEGALLGYWTDIPQVEMQRLTVAIRALLGDFEP